jgi:hypothetical protein
MLKALRRLVGHPYFPVLLIIAINLVIGSRIATDFGESWDEQLRYRYADKSLAAYLGDLRTLRDEKGPFYVMIARLGSEGLVLLNPAWQSIDGWHFMHFLSFQLAIFFIYDLAIRRLRKAAAVGVALLFSTQPLLWGHAFINPKDIPFMAFFLGSVALGMRMVERLAPLDGDASFGNSSKPLREAWLDWKEHNLEPDSRRAGRNLIWSVILLGMAGMILLLVVARGYFLERIAWLVSLAYQQGNTTLLGRLFGRLAQNAASLPVDDYVHKALALYPMLVAVLFLLWLALAVWLLARWFPSTTVRLRRQVLRPGISAYGRSFRSPALLGAGLLLGLTTSIRVLGPLAGGLVAVYAVLKLRRRAVPLLAAYISLALIVTYVTWPALWGDPLRAFSASFQMASDFDWQGKVLFAGIEYSSGNLPASYLPTLIAIQLGETTLLLFLLGLAVAVWRFYQERSERAWFVMLSAWFFLPLLGVILLRPNLYDNARHFIFILPPLFLFGGYALDALSQRIQRTWLVYALVALLALPNVVALVRLHPYPYIYYNALVGGPHGAFREYEMDYWATSYREATSFVNQVANPAAGVVVWGPDHIVRRFARPDLQVIEYGQADTSQGHAASYAIISTRHNKDQTEYPLAPVVYRIEREGALLAVVKQLDAEGP